MAGSRTLLIRASAFGDVLLLTPFIRQLQAQNPGGAIDLYTLQDRIPWPGVGKVVSMRTHSLREALGRGYDRVLGFSYEFHPGLHVQDAYGLSTGLALGDRTLSWPAPTPQEARWAEGILAGLRGPLIGFHPRSNQPTRSLAPEVTRHVIRRLQEELGATVLVTGEAYQSHEGCVDLTGRVPSLNHLGALMARLDGIITTDTGPFHLAQALAKPTVAIFGCTLPELRVTRREHLQVVMHPGLACLGCYHDRGRGRESLPGCARGDLACMVELEAGPIVAAMGRALAGEEDRALRARLERYEERRDTIVSGGPGSKATQEAFWSGLEHLDRRLGGFKRFRRRLRSLIST